MYVCGSDHARHIARGFGHPRKGLAVVTRQGERAGKSSPNRLVFWCGAAPGRGHAALSSTGVRKALRNGQWKAAEEMVGASVLAFIREHGLYGVPHYFSQPLVL